MPVTKLNGFMLTWYYFGYSWPLVIIIAVLEIGGAVLLLFRRTTLLGAFLLLPVMVNIIFVNYFYNIPVVLPSLFMTAGLFYLISLHWNRLKQLLLNTADYLPEISKGFKKNALRFGVVLLAFATQVQWVTPLRTEKTDTLLQGKWEVDQQVINGSPTPANSWADDSTVSVWSNLYLEDGWFSISNNPFYFDSKRAKHGN